LKKGPINEQEIVDVLLSQFNVDPAETRIYLQLVREGQLTVHEVSKASGTNEEETRNILERMVSRGLIIRAPGPASKFAALHPRMTLTNLFKTYEKSVVQALRDRRASSDRIVNLLTVIYEERAANRPRNEIVTSE